MQLEQRQVSGGEPNAENRLSWDLSSVLLAMVVRERFARLFFLIPLLCVLVACDGSVSKDDLIPVVGTALASQRDEIGDVVATAEAWWGGKVWEREDEQTPTREVIVVPMPLEWRSEATEEVWPTATPASPDNGGELNELVRYEHEYESIQEIYQHMGIVYPYSLETLVARSENLYVNDQRHFVINVHEQRAEDDARLITKICYVLLGERAFDFLREVRQVETEEWIFAWANADERVIGIGDTNVGFSGDMGAKRKTAIHEIVHLIDLGAGNFDVPTRLQLEKIKAEAMSRYNIFRVYDSLYIDVDANFSTYSDGNFFNPFYHFGEAAIVSFDRDPHQHFFEDDETNLEFVTAMAGWQSNGWSHEDRLRVGRLLLELQMASADLSFQDPELADAYQRLLQHMDAEVWAELVAHALSGDGSVYNQDAELKEWIRRYFEIASGRRIDNVESLITSMRYEGGLWDVDDPVEVFIVE